MAITHSLIQQKWVYCYCWCNDHLHIYRDVGAKVLPDIQPMLSDCIQRDQYLQASNLYVT